MSNIEKQYQGILRKLILYGSEKNDRTGAKTLSYFGDEIRHKLSDGFPLLTTKKMAWKSIVTELIWFLKGRTDIRYLNENGCKIWNGDAYKAYERTCMWELERPEYTEEEFIQRIMEDDDFNRVWGQLGPIYGKQWRDWNGNDQIQNLINELKNNPESRRLMVSAWNVGELHEMTLPPCHYGFQCYTRELTIQERIRLGNFEFGEVVNDKMCDEQNIPKRELSLLWNQRSVDTFLGLPFNIASYALLLTIIAREVNMVPGEIVGHLGDVHLYLNHIEQAKEQIKRTPYELPTLKWNSKLNEEETWLFGKNGVILEPNDFLVDGYTSHPVIKAPLNN